MSQFKWGNPEILWVLMMIPVFVGLYFFLEAQVKNKLQKSFGNRISPWLSQSVSESRLRFQFSLKMVGISLVIVALARPQLGQSQQEMKSEGVELIILADVSDSMLAEDIKPNRLERMKIELEKLMDLMPGNKTGLIAFAGSSSLMTPLTSDPSALKMYIQSLDTNSVSTQGTHFETALSYAAEAFEKGGVTENPTAKATRVILVASDGEDQEPNALDEAKKLAEKGIHIISVAYGTEKGGTIPSFDVLGQFKGSKKDRSDQVIVTSVKGDFLKSLAQKTNGSFYFSSYSGDHLKSIMNDIDNYEKTQFSSTMTLQYNEIYIYPLMVALIVLLFSLSISGRHRRKRSIEVTYEA